MHCLHARTPYVGKTSGGIGFFLAHRFSILSIAVICQEGDEIELLNTTIWIYSPEPYPTRVRAFGTAFTTALGTAAGVGCCLLREPNASSMTKNP